MLSYAEGQPVAFASRVHKIAQKVIIPRSLRAEMLKRIHSSHIGGDACYRQARDTLYRPGMQAEIKDFVNEFAHNQQKETMLFHDFPNRP